MATRALIILTLSALWASADPQDADRSEAVFRQYWNDRFTSFTQEQNVFGKGQSPNGKTSIAGRKRKFNNDDGMQYEGYLTYHDFSFNTIEKAPEKNPTPSPSASPDSGKTRTLYGFISEHGKESAAGGSSLLERTVYEQHEKFLKEEDDARKNGKSLDDDKTGIKYRSIFKVTTDKIFKKPNAAAGGGTSGSGASKASAGSASKDPDEEDQKVERWELRPEVKETVEKVGEEAFKTVESAAKDRDSQSDDNALPNSTLLYEAAGRAYDAWWNSTLANLGQARANRAIRGGSLGVRAQLSEKYASCEQWVSATKAKLQSESNVTQSDEKELERMLNQCKEVAEASYRKIDPSFERDSNDPNAKEKLQENGTEKEEARERDLRNQLETLANPLGDPDNLETNWKYQPKDFRSKVTVGFDENARDSQTSELTPKDQVDSYNAQLESAAKGLEEVKKRLPTLDAAPKQILQYQVAGQKSAKEISALPEDIYSEDSGVAKPKSIPLPKNYSQLLKRQK